jgi:hypothetical protein
VPPGKDNYFEQCNGDDGGQGQNRLHAAAGLNAKTIDCSKDRKGGDRDYRIAERPLRELKKITGEGDRHGRDPASLNDQQ